VTHRATPPRTRARRRSKARLLNRADHAEGLGRWSGRLPALVIPKVEARNDISSASDGDHGAVDGYEQTAQATSSPDRHDTQGSGDFYLAISGDLQLATSGHGQTLPNMSSRLLTRLRSYVASLGVRRRNALG
jgi:hypothetical protein